VFERTQSTSIDNNTKKIGPYQGKSKFINALCYKWERKGRKREKREGSSGYNTQTSVAGFVLHRIGEKNFGKVGGGPNFKKDTSVKKIDHKEGEGGKRWRFVWGGGKFGQVPWDDFKKTPFLTKKPSIAV